MYYKIVIQYIILCYIISRALYYITLYIIVFLLSFSYYFCYLKTHSCWLRPRCQVEEKIRQAGLFFAIIIIIIIMIIYIYIYIYSPPGNTLPGTAWFKQVLELLARTRLGTHH